jgi:hypothetical protein
MKWAEMVPLLPHLHDYDGKSQIDKAERTFRRSLYRAALAATHFGASKVDGRQDEEVRAAESAVHEARGQLLTNPGDEAASERAAVAEADLKSKYQQRAAANIENLIQSVDLSSDPEKAWSEIKSIISKYSSRCDPIFTLRNGNKICGNAASKEMAREMRSGCFNKPNKAY